MRILQSYGNTRQLVGTGDSEKGRWAVAKRGSTPTHLCSPRLPVCDMLSSSKMLKDLLGKIWLRAPRSMRRLTMRLTQTRFTVTAAGIVVDKKGRVLLLKHRFRPGSGWGMPGGFIAAGEQPEEGLRRELREEIGLELERAQLFATRAFKKPRQIEIIFRCRSKGDALPQSMEIRKAAWFSPDSLPGGLPEDQGRLIKLVLIDGAKQLD